MAIRHTFHAYERLKREQHIDTLFHTGKAFSVFPVRAIYIMAVRPAGESVSPVQVGFSVPKKKFGSSVKRHRIRRLMAEAWRLHKHLLYPTIPADKQLHVFLIFTTTELPEYETVRASVEKVIGRLINIATSLPPPASAALAGAT